VPWIGDAQDTAVSRPLQLTGIILSQPILGGFITIVVLGLSFRYTRWPGRARTQDIDASVSRSAIAVQNLGNFVEMGIDLIGQIVKLAPCLAKVRRFVCRLQELTILPLDVVYDASSIEASMQADRDKARLPRHEARSFCHERQRLLLLLRLGFDNGDLGDDLVVCLNLGHARSPFFESGNAEYSRLLSLGTENLICIDDLMESPKLAE
jgi:hypothetical protein